MAAVLPPMPTAQPALPPQLVTGGELSEAQLEAIIMANDAHEHDLPGRFVVKDDWTGVEPAAEGEGVALRQGFMIGDGTGAGKAAKRRDHHVRLARGRTRAVWLSKSKTLIEDAIRDWTDLGGSPTDIQSIDRWRPDEAITLGRGILFLTYATLRSVGKTGRRGWSRSSNGPARTSRASSPSTRRTRCRTRPDRAKGAAPRRRSRASRACGCRSPCPAPASSTSRRPAPRTSRTSPMPSRLGLWGPGDAYPFTTREDFVAAMEAGGVAAMEVVARDLKALGLYTARALSFEGVEYDILEHRLSDDERAIYDTFASAFRVIHQNLRAALEATGIVDAESGTTASAAKASALSRFESMKQRFFGHVLNGFKARTIIDAIEADLRRAGRPSSRSSRPAKAISTAPSRGWTAATI